MGKRKLPFGYQMEMGIEIVHSKEAQVVRDIFNRYLAGESFNLLAQSLNKQPILYDEGKPWNINMVARILEDSRYAGDKGFPTIIESTVFHAVAKRRKAQRSPIHRTETEKILRQLCGCPPSAKITSQVLRLLNFVACNTQTIQNPPPPSQADTTTCRIELERILMQLPVDEEKANILVKRSASLCYQAIGPGMYETERLKHIFSDAQPVEQLDAELLRSTVTSINVERNTVVGIQLKNGQFIERNNQT